MKLKTPLLPQYSPWSSSLKLMLPEMYPTQYTTIIFVPVHMTQCHLTQYTHYVPPYLTTIPPMLSYMTWWNYINFLTIHLRMSLLPKYPPVLNNLSLPSFATDPTMDLQCRKLLFFYPCTCIYCENIKIHVDCCCYHPWYLQICKRGFWCSKTRSFCYFYLRT